MTTQHVKTARDLVEHLRDCENPPQWPPPPGGVAIFPKAIRAWSAAHDKAGAAQHDTAGTHACQVCNDLAPEEVEA
jgi:hypothetical protein